jgi:hypothetical protein
MKRIDVNPCNYRAVIDQDPEPGPILTILDDGVHVWEPPGRLRKHEKYYVLPFTADKKWVKKAVRMVLKAREDKLVNAR